VTVELNAQEVFDLATDLETAASTVNGKAKNIIKRAGAEIRESWQASAREFPSPTKARNENYDISFDMRGTNANTAVVTVGSSDPLLAVIEYGSANHAPQLHGAHALERASQGVAEALGWINGVTKQ
jgi:hypothetical protein